MDRLEVVHDNFRRQLEGDRSDSTGAGDDPEAVAIFRAQCISRCLDRRARKMQASGQGYYTIGSSGHEGMAAVAAAVEPTDPAFLHYRDGAFQTMRASQVGIDPVPDMLASFATLRADPMSGGRHKVLGSKALCIPPQTSTIASHLPKAVGAAYAIGLARRHRPEHATFSDDALVVCSFGDASVNHSTAQGAFNTACWTAYQSSPLPLLFVCEDNGIGISVPTPGGWIAANFADRAALKYFYADGLDVFETRRVAREAAHYVRHQRKPAFLHLSLVRLGGHAGSDAEQAYLDPKTFEGWEADDPLLHTARGLAARGILTPGEALALYDALDRQCAEVAAGMVGRPRLENAAQVMASLIPPARKSTPVRQGLVDSGKGHETMSEPQTLSRLLNRTLTDLMRDYPEIVMMGEDIGGKGGVYGVTRKLQSRFGVDRVIDTLLDEQSILGLAIGMAHNGFVPMPEIQFLAYLHNAEDQLRGEAATLSFFSQGQFTNPMVVRIAGLGYQKGFGGHFHNDNSLAVLRDIPGVIVAVPSRGGDAVRMLRRCVALARESQRVVVFVEPIALYHTRDLHAEGDGGWLEVYPEDDSVIAEGEVGVTGTGALALVSYGNGHYLSRQAAVLLADKGIDSRVIDLRWLAPLPVAGLLSALEGCTKVLVVDECRRSGNVSEGLMTLLAEQTDLPCVRLAAEDSFIATGPAYAATLPSRDGIVAAAESLWAR